VDGRCEVSCDVSPPPPLDGGTADAGTTTPDGGLPSCSTITPSWSRAFGSTSADAIVDVDVDGAGNIYVLGKSFSTIDLGGGALTSTGSSDVVIASYEADGTHRWSRTLGGPGEDLAGRMDVADDGTVYLSGSFVGSIEFDGATHSATGTDAAFVASFDSAGTPRWIHTFGGDGAGNSAMGVSADPSGGVWVAATIAGAIDLDGEAVTSAGQDLFLLHALASDGSALHEKLFVNPGRQTASDLAVDAAGNVYLTGTVGGTVDVGLGPTVAAAEPDTFLASFTSEGTPRFAHVGVGSGFDLTHGLAVDETGVVVVGSFTGTMTLGGGTVTSGGVDDGFVARYLHDGTHDWSATVGGAGFMSGEETIGVDVSPTGEICVAGAFAYTMTHGTCSVTSTGRWDIGISCFMTDGTPTGAARFGGSLEDGALSIHSTMDGELVFGGLFRSGTIELGATTYSSAGGYDGVFAKMPRP
jgi:hypothetical protein